MEARQGYKSLMSKKMTVNNVLSIGESLKLKSIEPKKIVSRFTNSSTSPGTMRRGKWQYLDHDRKKHLESENKSLF